jgi:hypothetical protein
MRIRTNTALTPSGKLRVKTTVRAAPMLPALRSSGAYSVLPSAFPKRKRRRRAKKR